MTQATRTETFDVDINKIYQVLCDYESYSEYMTGVDKVSVLEKLSDSEFLVEYQINVIKKLKYVLKLVQTEPTQVKWTFDSGDLFKVNQGSWDLKDLGDGKTEVTYNVEIQAKGFIPGSGKIAQKLTETQLPGLMSSIKERAKAL